MTNIEIELNLTPSGSRTTLFTGPVSSRSTTTRANIVNIDTQSIRIELRRSTMPIAPFAAHNSTFFKMIVKSLALYYTLERRPALIDGISWRRISNAGEVSEYPVSAHEIVQIVASHTDLSLLKKILPGKAQILMKETEAARAVLYAVTHLIKALDSSGPFERFDRLWRSFNALYKSFAHSTKDSDCHIALANDIRSNPTKYPLTIAKVSTLTAAKIRKHTRWNLMLQNNYPTVKRTKALHDTVIRTMDSRILEIYRETLSVRSDFLMAAGFLSAVTTHLKAEASAPKINHSDVAITLCIKYMYFVRNKIAHAERIDSGFTFLRGSADESEILWLTPMLEALIVDLINLSDTF